MTRYEIQEAVAAADLLVRGYEEEINLYTAVRDLALRQKEMLQDVPNLLRFCKLLDEKEDLLRIIGRIETEMKSAKAVVTSVGPNGCPHRLKLATLLDKVRDMIEDIRAIEHENVSLLETVAV